MVLAALLVLVGGMACDLYPCPETSHPLLCHVLHLVGDSLLVIGISVLLTETGPFKSYVEERLASLAQLVNKPVLEAICDPNFLRMRLSSNQTREIRKAATLALLPKIAQYPEFLSVVDDVMMPMAEKAVWRKEYTVTIIHEIVKSPGGKAVIRETQLMEAKYVNLCASPITIDAPCRRQYKRIPGAGYSDDELCYDMKCSVNGKERAVDWKSSPTSNDTVVFDGGTTIEIGQLPVSVRFEHKAYLQGTETTRFTFFYPTTGIDVIYRHPPEVNPDLHAFNVGGSLEVVSESSDLHHWKHSGVFLPDHGLVLEHWLHL